MKNDYRQVTYNSKPEKSNGSSPHNSNFAVDYSTYNSSTRVEDLMKYMDMGIQPIYSDNTIKDLSNFSINSTIQNNGYDDRIAAMTAAIMYGGTGGEVKKKKLYRIW